MQNPITKFNGKVHSYFSKVCLSDFRNAVSLRSGRLSPGALVTERINGT